MHVDRQAIAELCERRTIEELALFGSAIRDDFGADSDVDVLVEFVPGARITLFKLMEIQDELKALFGREVDLVTKRSLSPFFRDQVLAKREVLYVRAH